MTKLTPILLRAAAQEKVQPLAFRNVPQGRLPDAPLAMPTQILEQPSRFGQRIRALLSLPLGRAET